MVKLILKNRLFQTVARDPSGQPLYQIKGRPFSPQKVIAAGHHEILYCTDIIVPEASFASAGGPDSRRYIVCRGSGETEPVLTASIGYEASGGKDARRLPYKLPRAERLNIQAKEPGQSGMTIRMERDGSCRIYDQQNRTLGTLSGYRPFRGYELESSFITDGGLLCALFVLTRYMAEENELIVV
ncbi:hypothetical protein [Caproiciproducens sp.]